MNQLQISPNSKLLVNDSFVDQRHSIGSLNESMHALSSVLSHNSKDSKAGYSHTSLLDCPLSALLSEFQARGDPKITDKAGADVICTTTDNQTKPRLAELIAKYEEEMLTIENQYKQMKNFEKQQI